MHKVFIDGQEGTTGLKIRDRLAPRKDIQLLGIADEHRKDPAVKKEIINRADVVILCLPDDAAKESVALIENPATKVIDASTAFRTAPGWVYGCPELDGDQRGKIRAAKRVANPGCHATGFVMGLYPLIKTGIVPRDYPVTCYSVTGYSGGGKKLIQSFEQHPQPRPAYFHTPRTYALGLKHKHVPEMETVCGLDGAPVFNPVIGDFYNGMAVSIPLHSRLLAGKPGAREVWQVMHDYYAGEYFVKVIPFDSAPYLHDGFISPLECNETNRIEVFVFGYDTQLMVVTRFDNLGKGASGAAVQNLNIMLGVDEKTGLTV